MRTAYECMIDQYSYSKADILEALINLIKLSKSVPWILDPRVKFWEIRHKRYEVSFLFFAKKDDSSGFDFFPFYPKTNEEARNPECFHKEKTFEYNLHPSWMEIETSS